MKRIIGIPEEVYKTVQDGSYCGSLYEELKASIPYNPSGDLISRNDALKAVDTRHEELLHDTEYRKKHCQIDLLGIKKHILAIPPANILKPANDDLISREDLKKEVEGLVVGGAEGLKDYYENGSKADENSWIGGVYDAYELIDKAPPVVEPERLKGEWIKVKEEIMSVDTVTLYKCSECERVIATLPSKLAKYYPFCHCGADMRKGGAE